MIFIQPFSSWWTFLLPDSFSCLFVRANQCCCCYWLFFHSKLSCFHQLFFVEFGSILVFLMLSTLHMHKTLDKYFLFGRFLWGTWNGALLVFEIFLFFPLLVSWIFQNDKSNVNWQTVSIRSSFTHEIKWWLLRWRNNCIYRKNLTNKQWLSLRGQI